MSLLKKEKLKILKEKSHPSMKFSSFNYFIQLFFLVFYFLFYYLDYGFFRPLHHFRLWRREGLSGMVNVARFFISSFE